MKHILSGVHKLLVLLRMFELLIVHVYIIEKHILLLLYWNLIILNLIIIIIRV